MYKLETSSKFEKQYKKIAKNAADIKLVDGVLEILLNDAKLEAKHKDHPLKGNYAGYRECHIKPDLLLVYKKFEEKLILVCVRLGSHSEIF